MELHDLPGDGKPQAGAPAGAVLLPAVEPLPDLLQLIPGKGRAVVLHGEAGPVPLPPDPGPNCAPRRGVAHGVGRQVAHGLAQPALVGGHRTGIAARKLHRQLPVRRCGLQPPEHGPGHLRQIEVIPGKLDFSGLQAAQVQHLQHHGVQLLRLRQDGVQVLLPLLRGDVLPQPLAAAVDHRQGGLQLVGHV